jgi:HAD superfamily hydrolase (TIGR01509 family)
VFGYLGESVSDEAAMGIFGTYLAAYEQSWKLYDDVLPCLESLSGYRLAVISNGDSDQQRRKLEQTGIAPYFSSVVISGDLGVSKPHPDIFRQSLQALGLLPQEAVYVGDRLEVDALGAEGAGMHGVWLVRGGCEGDPADLPVVVKGFRSNNKVVLSAFTEATRIAQKRSGKASKTSKVFEAASEMRFYAIELAPSENAGEASLWEKAPRGFFLKKPRRKAPGASLLRIPVIQSLSQTKGIITMLGSTC